jgi:precorrin-2/cobalt-factor-2 C20-methyltransferase
MKPTGTFFGIGVGPGEPGLIPVLAWEALKQCGAVFVPRATSQETSTAKGCLPLHDIPGDHFHEVEFDMSTEHDALLARYTTMAQRIAQLLRSGCDVAYLTLGDSMTYSTFNYTLRAVQSACPEAPCRVFPGISSYAALAAATGFPLGEGKERVLILPCPDSIEALERALKQHDITVLMKIGRRLPEVISLLDRMQLCEHSVFGGRVGMPDAVCRVGIGGLLDESPSGYLSTMLIRNPSPLPL